MLDPSLINSTQAERHAEEAPNNIGERELLWTRHYGAGVPKHLAIPDYPLTWLLDNAASRYPYQTALYYYGRELTYAELCEQVNRFAKNLLHLGVQTGERIAIALPNIPQFPIAFYGALRAGAVVVPTNPLYTERELEHQLTDSGAQTIILLDMFYPRIRTIRHHTALRRIIVTSVTDFLPPLLRFLYPLTQRDTQKQEHPLSKTELRSDPMLYEMKQMLQRTQSKGGIELFNLPVKACGDDLAALQYTGGTTGQPKGAMLSHRNLLANAMQTRSWVTEAQDGKEIALCATPFFHVYGLTVGMNLSIMAAATMVLLPKFSASEIARTIQKTHPSMFPGIPTMYIALMRNAGKNTRYLQSIKYCISGAAPLPEQVRIDFEQLTGGKLVEGYGLSEAAPVTHCNPLTEEYRNGSIGIPLPEIESQIMASNGDPAPVGEAGEIVVKGPNIMKGYWNRDSDTQNIFTHGWMRTGDIGKMDADGYFYILERTKDLIIASGFNIYPREVEEVLFQHPAIAEAAVIGIPDSYRGETVMAFIVLKPGHTASAQTRDEIIAFCKQHLTAYKVPKRLEFRSALPKSAIGKVLRRELRPSA